MRLKHGEIGAAAEGVLAGRDDRAFDGGVGGDFIDERSQFLDDARVDDVHRALGHVPGDQRDAVGVDIEFEIRHRCAPSKYGSPFFLRVPRTFFVALDHHVDIGIVRALGRRRAYRLR